MNVKNTDFAKYGADRCKPEKGVFVFSTNPSIQDLNHPVHVAAASLHDVDKEYLAFVHRPSLGPINPSDCVGEKKKLCGWWL